VALRRRLPGTSPPSPETADSWLVRLRWIAALGMLATTLIGRHLVPQLALTPLLITLGGIVLLNLAWTVFPRRLGSHIQLQIYVDVLALTVMLWFSGGVGNPFAIFLTFHIVLAGLLAGGRTAIIVTMMTILAAGLLRLAPALPLESAPLGEARVQWIGELVAVGAAALFIGFFVLVYVQRVDELRAESARNERLAILGRVVGGLSHEVNTPLNTILLASQELVAVGGEGGPEVTRLAETIAAESRRASDIIGLMRGHIRPDQHKEPVDLEVFVAELAGRELDRLGFRGERVITAPVPVRLPVLRAGVAHVLVNVLTNAVQATAPLAAPRIEIGVSARGARVDISVEDNGPGISRDLLPHLGEPFHTTKGDQGMGLGLYVSSVLAERMEGDLHIEVPERGGTRVILSLRRA
jgi:two-component system, sensor histidine kinase RegB